ncbi:MAG TPA: hypothetical protein VNK70_01040 [Candidatus Paceibacterota bacterium]|nr:hypothetical protein [Candidatus Paceibacterota bacterium]
MFSWIKNLFRKTPPLNKQVGGFELPGGIVIGPAYFSQNGQQSSVLLCPPIWAFNYSVTNILNRLTTTTPAPEEFQSIFNSLLDGLVADILVYAENRLKIIVIRDKLKYKMNSVPECLKAYRNLANIDIRTLCDVGFLKSLDRARGDRHHTHRRYDANYSIGGVVYGDMTQLRALTSRVRTEIQRLDQGLAATHRDYDVNAQQTPAFVRVEWTAVGHAFDMTAGGKIVPKRPVIGGGGPDPSNISYFAIQANYRQ